MALNKKIYSRFAICYMLFAICSTLIVPLIASAASFPYWGPLVSCSGDLQSAHPCASLCDLLKTGQNIIYFIMTLAVLAVGPVMIVVGGIMMLVAAGSPERFSSGRKIATGAVIGIAIALGAFVIVNTFFVLIAAGTGTSKRSWSNIQCPPSFQPGGGQFRGAGASGDF